MATQPATVERLAPQGFAGGWRSALDGVMTLWYRDLLRFVRDRSRIIGSLAQPILFLVVFGAGLTPSMGQLGGESNVSYIKFIFPGIIAMSVLFTSIFNAVSVIWDREFGFLKEVLVAPVPRWSLVVGKALGASTTAMIQGVLLLILAPLLGVGISPSGLVKLLIFMFITAFSLSGLGLFVAGRMRSMEGFQMVMNFLMMPMFFLSGALFPVNDLPGWLTFLTRIDPVSYGVDAIRTVLLTVGTAGSGLGMTLFGHRINPWLDMLIVLAFGAVMIGLAVHSFSNQE